ncbi:uncharacterized protein LOC107646365 [Arachis ipaensis]|uniref:uncharacterized protein LOC107646365 n=1 Tax=Arachis ipaensis TaxID=130454 RepID=UPI0007AFA137|nr:uncharacterized protein LOC107646365 [Arachis ipaensis]
MNTNRNTPSAVYVDMQKELKTSILQKAGLCGTKWVKKVFYKIPIAVVSTGVQCETFFSGSENTRAVCQVGRWCRQFWGISAESSVDDGRGASTSMPVIAPGCLLTEPPSVPVELAMSPDLIPGLLGDGKLDRVENAMRENDSDDEPDHIIGDSNEVEDTPRNPPTCQGPSSSGFHQHPPHFSTLNLEAVGQQLDLDPTFGGQGLHKENIYGKFQIGQSFQTKEEVVLSVKDYNIRHGAEYRVMESNHLKYHRRCKEFENGCTWMIRITLRQRKGNWEVRRYNGPHTCLATSISSDYRQLDHHVICARIFPLIRADAAVTIKVL